MSEHDSAPDSSADDPNSKQNMKAAKDYEAIVQRLAFAAINEQRRSRRWRIFFIILTFLYLTPVVMLTLDLNELNIFDQTSKTSDKHTALVKLSGIIASGESAGAKNVIKGLKNAFEDKDTAAVILEINSPGGSPVQSADIYDEMKRLREDNADTPLYVVVNDIAASGGYFVASAADKIFVNKSSLVGSIGVRMDNFGLVDMIEKLGIERRLMTAGEHKGLMDPFLPEDAEQKQHLQTMLDQVHQHFISAVKSGRGERLQDSPDIFSGLIWSGEEAIRKGLVDAYGSSQSVARDVVKQEELVDFTPRELLLDRLADRVGASFGRIVSSQFFNHMQFQSF